VHSLVSLRWRIEDWHRVLKSGCRIEELAHQTAERLKRAIAINLVQHRANGCEKAGQLL